MAKTLEISISKYEEITIVADLSKVDQVDPKKNRLYKVDHYTYTPGCDVYELMDAIFQNVESLEFETVPDTYFNRAYSHSTKIKHNAKCTINGETLYLNSNYRGLNIMKLDNGDKPVFLTFIQTSVPFNNFTQFKILYTALFEERGVLLKLSEFVKDRLGLEIESCYTSTDWAGRNYYYVKPVDKYGMKFAFDKDKLKFLGYIYDDNDGYEYVDTIESLEQDLVNIQKKLDTLREHHALLGESDKMKELFKAYVQKDKA